MKVCFYDIVPKLCIGMTQQRTTAEEVLSEADFVTIHVPETAQTKGLIGPREISLLKRGAHFLNLSRGNVVDLDALADAIKDGRVGGAAIDVYPFEPESAAQNLVTPLQGLRNVILTPHIGGSTVEAQHAIGAEVATALSRFHARGATTGAVNFPEVEPPTITEVSHRIINVHRNHPGVLKRINLIVSEMDVNIRMQILATNKNIGYLVMDTDQGLSEELKKKIAELDDSICTRII
jgi:D-3-phosphoglycerate dehydrogenase